MSKLAITVGCLVLLMLLAVPERAAAQGACTVQITPNPLPLVSFFPFLDSGFQNAVAVNCVFVADLAVLVAPLDGFPITPLPFTSDTWFLFDNGGPNPCGFVPCPVPGDIAYVSLDGGFHTNFGHIILTILN